MSGSGTPEAVPSATAGKPNVIGHGYNTQATLGDKYLKPKGRDIDKDIAHARTAAAEDCENVAA